MHRSHMGEESETKQCETFRINSLKNIGRGKITHFFLNVVKSTNLGWVVRLRPIVRMWDLGLRGECPLWGSF